MSLRLNIGCGRNIMEGWLNIDQFAGPGVDLTANLDSKWTKLPFDDNSVDEFLLSHVLEHINYTLPLMQELHRIARPEAVCTIKTPYGSSDDAWEDPTHVRPYFINSFGYFGQPFYWRADYGYSGDWRVSKVTLRVPIFNTPILAMHKETLLGYLAMTRNNVSEMTAMLEAVKPIREPKAELQEPVTVDVVV